MQRLPLHGDSARSPGELPGRAVGRAIASLSSQRESTASRMPTKSPLPNDGTEARRRDREASRMNTARRQIGGRSKLWRLRRRSARREGRRIDRRESRTTAPVICQENRQETCLPPKEFEPADIVCSGAPLVVGARRQCQAAALKPQTLSVFLPRLFRFRPASPRGAFTAQQSGRNIAYAKPASPLRPPRAACAGETGRGRSL